MNRADRRSALAATTMALTASASMLATLWAGGMTPWSTDPATQEAAPAQVGVAGLPINVTDTPAHRFAADLAADLSADLGGRSVVPSALPPFPLACTGQDALTPVASTSLTVTAGAQAQVYAVVYPAGQGAAELAAQVDPEHLRSCTDGSSAYRTTAEGPGTEAYQVSAAWNGARATTRVWRHGDVVLYAVVDRSKAPALDQIAAEIDRRAVALLGEQCVDPASVAADATRSPFFAGAVFTGWTAEEQVSIPVPSLPDVPAAHVVTTADDSAPAEPVYTVPMPAADIVEVDRPDYPDHPVWPYLPDSVPIPEPPAEPADPELTATIVVTKEDRLGPGCGWAFTGQQEPPYDRAAAEAKAAADTAAARATLEVDAARWQAEVSRYWLSWPSYTQKVAAYAAYAAQVEVVRAQWALIAEEWADYEERVGEYEAALADHAAQVAERDALRAQYDAAVLACTPPDRATPSPTPTPTPTPTSPPPTTPEPTEAPTPPATEEPTPTPEPTATPAAPVWTAPESCPAQLPAELAEPLPDPPVAPTPPADPRPESER